MIYGEFFLPLGREMERPRMGARTFVLQSFRGGIVACRQLLVGEGFFPGAFIGRIRVNMKPFS